MDCAPSTVIDWVTATAAAARLDLPSFAITSSSCGFAKPGPPYVDMSRRASSSGWLTIG